MLVVEALFPAAEIIPCLCLKSFFMSGAGFGGAAGAGFATGDFSFIIANTSALFSYFRFFCSAVWALMSFLMAAETVGPERMSFSV